MKEHVLVIGNSNVYWTNEFINEYLVSRYDIDFIDDIQDESFAKNDYVKVIKYKYKFYDKLILKFPKIRVIHSINIVRRSVKIKYNKIFVILSNYKHLKIADHLLADNGKVYCITIGSEVLNNSYRSMKFFKKKLFDSKFYFIGSSQKVTNCLLKLSNNSLIFNTIHFALHLENFDCEKKQYMMVKQKLSIDPSFFTICIGYNGRIEQQHVYIIESLNRLPEEYKNKIHIIIPMTYMYSDEIYLSVKKKLDEINVKYDILTKYMNRREMNDLWHATDIFINAQISDALSASVLEAMYYGAHIIFGGWLNYPEYDTFHLSADSFENTDELNECIKQIISKGVHKNYVNHNIIQSEFTVNKFISEWDSLINGK